MLQKWALKTGAVIPQTEILIKADIPQATDLVKRLAEDWTTGFRFEIVRDIFALSIPNSAIVPAPVQHASPEHLTPRIIKLGRKADPSSPCSKMEHYLQHPTHIRGVAQKKLKFCIGL